MSRFLFLFFIVFVVRVDFLHARVSTSTFNDIREMLQSGQESAAELTSYYYLRNYPKTEHSVDVKFLLAEIYQRQTRFEEMVLWLKDLEKDPQLDQSLQPKLAYLLLQAQEKRGDKSAAEIQRSLLLRKYPNSEWAKKVSAK